MTSSAPAVLEFLRPTWLRSRLRGPDWLLDHVPAEHMHDVRPHDTAVEAGDCILHNVKQLEMLHQAPAIAWLYLQLQLLGVLRVRFLELWQLLSDPEASQDELWHAFSQTTGLVPRTRHGQFDRRPFNLRELQQCLLLLYFVPKPAPYAVVQRSAAAGQHPTHCFPVADQQSNLMLLLCSLLELRNITGLQGHVPLRWAEMLLSHGSLRGVVQRYDLQGMVKDMKAPFRVPIVQADSARLALETAESWPPLQDTMVVELHESEARQLGLQARRCALRDVATAACLQALGRLYHRVRHRLQLQGVQPAPPDGDEFFLELYEDLRQHGLLDTEQTRMEDRILKS